MTKGICNIFICGLTTVPHKIKIGHSTAMVMIVNNESNEVESITINYLTKGHTHIAADAVHANISGK